MMKLSLIISIIALSANGQPKIPSWNISVANNTNKSYGFPTIPATHYTIYNSTMPDGSKNPNGTYAQGAIITKWKGLYYVSWHNALEGESESMRQIYSTSDDLKSWSAPIELFPNLRSHENEENEPFITINDRLYSSNSYGNNGANVNNPVLMRQILGPSQMDEIFWLNETVPNAMKDLGYKTYLEMDAQTINDMNIYLSSLIWAIVANVTYNNKVIWFNERCMYLIPSTKNDIDLKIMVLLRQNCSGKCDPSEYASYCNIKQSKVVLKDNDHLYECRPGSQNLFWNLVEFVNTTNTNNKVIEPQTCNWTYPVKTNIPDAPSRTCTSTLPNGKIYLLGNQVQYTRDVLTLSTSSDGYVFDKAWGVKYDPPPIKWPGHWKTVGYMYPAGMRDDDNLYVTYDENKENILISIISLKDIN